MAEGKDNDTALNIDRRRFVRGVTAVVSGAIAVLSPLAALVPSRVWAVELYTLSATDAATLLAMIRTIAPHEDLDQAAYALVVGALDGDAAAASDNQRQLEAGIASLGADFSALAEEARVARLQKIEASAFFQSVRLKTVQVLYSNPIAYAHFGYEGEAFSKGGYLLRGFNDLKWLPEVPLAASGAMPVS